jgi:hypothetical protein
LGWYESSEFLLIWGFGKFHTNLELLSRDSSQLLINNSSCKYKHLS